MWRNVFSFFFPPSCVSCRKEGLLLCKTCEAMLPKDPEPIASATWRLFPYHHPVGERLIHAMKFEGKAALAEAAGKALAGVLPKILVGSTESTIIIPIPASKDERTKRGYDHVFLMAEHLAERSGALCFSALLKIRETERQVTMKTREKRLQNLNGAFRHDNTYDLGGKTLILLDDVTTTGATFSEAKRALKDSRAEKIICLALAH